MMKRYFLVFAICLAIPLLVNAQSLYKARKLMDKYNYAEAVEILKKASYDEKTKNEAIPLLAECYRLQRDIFNAKAAYAKAVALPEAKPEYFYFYAQALLSTGEYAKAKEMFREYAKKNPSDPRGNLFATHCDSVLGPWKQFPDPIEGGGVSDSANNDFISGKIANLKSADSLKTTHRIKSYIDNSRQGNPNISQHRAAPQYEIKIASNINTDQSDFGPVFYKKDLIFASDYCSPEEKKRYGWTGRGYLDMMKTRPLTADDFWGNMETPSKFEDKFNQKYHDGPAAFSSDGNSIYFTRSFYGKAKREGAYKTNMLKIYWAVKTNGVWGEAEPFFLNSKDFSVGHPALSVDGQTLYFISDMPGGAGGTDIWMCRREGDAWGAPSNLGPTVNTKENEMFPSIRNDGVLFFASEGQPGYGGLDIFRTKFIDGHWTSPANMHPPINGPYDDFAIAFAPGAKSGFFSSNRPGGVGNDDIYAFRKAEPPAPVILPTYISGLVKDKTTMLPIESATVFVFDTTTGIVKILKTDAGGMYITMVNKPSGYLVKAMKPNYIADCIPFALAEIKTGTTNTALHDLLLDKLVVNKAFRIENIYYDFDKYNIREDAKPELDKLARIMKENAINVELGSHTDCRGSFAYNDKLSQKRAESAVQYIINKGIDMGRITAKGYGERQLVNKCADGVFCTPQEHQANRRTEFKVTRLTPLEAVPEYDLGKFTGGEEIPAYALEPDFFIKCLTGKVIAKSLKATDTLASSSQNKALPSAAMAVYEKKKADKTVVAKPDAITYKVQLYVLSSKKPLDSPEFKAVVGLEIFEDNGKYKYASGMFETLGDAEAYRKKMVQLGFKDAFVVTCNNGKLTRVSGVKK